MENHAHVLAVRQAPESAGAAARVIVPDDAVHTAAAALELEVA